MSSGNPEQDRARALWPEWAKTEDGQQWARGNGDKIFSFAVFVARAEMALTLADSVKLAWEKGRAWESMIIDKLGNGEFSQLPDEDDEQDEIESLIHERGRR